MRTIVQLGILTAALVGTTACALRDIRPDPLVASSPTASDFERGRERVDAMASAHGIEVWRDTAEMKIVFRDTWPSAMMRGFGTPLKDVDTTVQMTFVPGSTFTNVTLFLDGKNAGNGAAAEGAETFALKDGERIPNGSMAYAVYAPALQFLWELPFRMAVDPDVVVWAGETVEEGRTLDRVLCTWGALEPDKDVDQYLLYIDRQTDLLVRSDYTVRVGGKPFASTIRFDDHRQVEGIVIAFQEEVDQFSPFKVAPLHTSQLLEIELRRNAPAG